ncbi:MAG TPA: hypothetical protein VEK79_23035 [Thermoanaerobaculia bacterium]|nr:hypothetical protein [Thermoanaerobaculia bacterium]
MRLRVGLGVVLFVLVVQTSTFAQCGVERWSIKTGTDSGAWSVNLASYVSSTIYNMHQSTQPASLPCCSRLSPRETTQYRLSGTLIKYNKQTDKDYHLVIRDSAGRTMIVEIADPNCVSGGAFVTGIRRARSQFDARFTATSTMKTTSTPVTIKGVGFWDFKHGQIGIAPNGIEIHPVLDITFGSSALAPGVTADAITEEGEIQEVLREGFVRDDDGGLVQIYRGGDAVPDSVLHHGGAVIADPAIQVIIIGERASIREELQIAREFSSAERLETLDRYGVRNTGLRVSGASLSSLGATANDLDVQRALANAVESGRIQHTDRDTIYVVMMERGTELSVGTTTDFLAYNSVFHPTELPMRYVVVKGGLPPAATREAVHAGVARAAVNPDGNGWF